MNVREIIEEIREEAQTNQNKATDDYLLRGINLDYAEFVMRILTARVDVNLNTVEYYETLRSAENLTPGFVGYNGEYPFPCDLLRPVRVEISYDGTGFSKADWYDLTDNKYSEKAGDQVNSVFSTTSPMVRFERNSFFIRPFPTTGADVEGGIHIWYEKRQNALTIDSTPCFIEPNYHRVLVYSGALRFARKFSEEYTDNWRQERRLELSRLESGMLNWEKHRFKKKFYMRPETLNYS